MQPLRVHLIASPVLHKAHFPEEHMWLAQTTKDIRKTMSTQLSMVKRNNDYGNWNMNSNREGIDLIHKWWPINYY